MLDPNDEPTVMEGTPDEIASFLKTLPPSRYHVQILGVDGPDAPKDFFAEAVQRAMFRSPDQIAASRRSILERCPKPREIPTGQNLEDVVAGKWPGQETDEQIEEALKRLS